MCLYRLITYSAFSPAHSLCLFNTYSLNLLAASAKGFTVFITMIDRRALTCANKHLGCIVAA